MRKIKKITQRLKNCYYDSIAFGLYIGITNLMWPVISKMPHFPASFLMKRKHRKVMDFLISKNSDVLEKYKLANEDTVYTEKSPIWVCWLQGEENMPDVPTQCLKFIKKNAGEHPVIFISLSNYSDYISLPQFILDKYENKIICQAHFSDIIRVVLLAEKGGCWIDSTILMTATISEEVFKLPFYSIKYEKSGYYITENMWSNFFLAGHKNSILFCFVRDMFYKYLEKEDRFIDYFLMDYLIRIGYNEVPVLKQMIDTVPFNNVQAHDLKLVLNDQFNKNVLGKYLKNTNVFKLNWRSKYELFADNSKTNWNFLINS